ncbi:hypothetical protein A0H76_1392 [Hepatospora eriocheir]|uniref:Integrase zinc-binding domain-containing protein n=1 Tax=Hepatospora eriocheir TaxID=1081669 RepID=A0A1X0QH64_9MICR|nr:hypothetical protein A0H76_1392 [Hepatospora eriocheir]
MLETIRKIVNIPLLERKLKEICNNCYWCQTNKVHNHQKTPIGIVNIPQKKFEVISSDIYGPFKL